MTTTTGTTAPGATVPAGASLHSGSTSAVPKANQEYNSQLFLKLLVTQLANQDPSSPMDSGQMVAQTAQLASMEQMTSLNATTTSTYQTQMQATGTSMLGKTVTWTDADGVAQTGKVTAVAFSGKDTPQLTIGSTTVGLSSITGVSAS
ncbi:flagellar hook capping FlgD N-terminal domain-containing protein [Amnibacterium setariae]|uniref:Flagellar hook capping protein n=1 Tax=Amnibacterium setariae TaxID=2306585 RepID=A0A3A1U7M9_9MICO|nr:flagellar hook capping FlgD N-terminal domain-containing protein [Amnibacterium setariae]RIX30289.1 flagellar hook capping protein [Amnibacterium setariae]